MRFHSGHNAFVACFGCLVLAVLTTASVKRQESSLATLTEAELKSLVIQFERTGCYGDCPAYRLTIRGDGRVEYDGLTNVKQTGSKQGHIEMVDVKNIVSQFDKARFLSIDQYSEKNCSCTLCTDMPTVTTEFRINGKSHRVEHYYGCRCAPKALWDVEESIDKIARVEQWTGDVSKQGPLGTTCFNPKRPR